MRRTFVLLALSLPLGADQLVYQKPPKEILDILNAPALPALSVRSYISVRNATHVCSAGSLPPARRGSAGLSETAQGNSRYPQRARVARLERQPDPSLRRA